MGCNKCGDKSQSRYGSGETKQVEYKTAQEQELAMRGEQVRQQLDSAVEKIRALSYEQLKESRMKQIQSVREAEDVRLKETTEAMKQVYVEELIAIVNGEDVLPTGTSPLQALVRLNRFLQRQDFSFMNKLYPTLATQVKDMLAERQHITI